MSLPAGTRLGPYEIVSFVAAGGMGEVYRAHDMRLKRSVAVKILVASFASDHDRLRRFQQEARAVAALNHPNILEHPRHRHPGRDVLSCFRISRGQYPACKARRHGAPNAQGNRNMRCKSHKGWEPPTTRASFIATSSRRISSSQTHHHRGQ